MLFYCYPLSSKLYNVTSYMMVISVDTRVMCNILLSWGLYNLNHQSSTNIVRILNLYNYALATILYNLGTMKINQLHLTSTMNRSIQTDTYII